MAVKNFDGGDGAFAYLRKRRKSHGGVCVLPSRSMLFHPMDAQNISLLRLQ